LLTAVGNVLLLDNREKGKPPLHFHENAEHFYNVSKLNTAKQQHKNIVLLGFHYDNGLAKAP